MTRIIGGAARGRQLRTPSGSATRPTADRVREALFSTLEARVGDLVGVRFLDVYAGSGAVGLEARSRGAAEVTLVESDRATAGLIRHNARTLALDGVTVLTAKAERLGTDLPPGGPFDVAFFDPPYSLPLARVGALLATMRAAGWFVRSAWLVVERPRRDESFGWPGGVEAVQSRRYGETVLWYGRVT